MIFQRDRFDSFLNHAPVPIAILNSDLRFLNVNQPMADAYQVPREAYAGKTFQEVLPAIALRIEPILARVLSTGERSEREIPDEHPWLAVCFPIGESEIVFMALESRERRIKEALQRTHRQLKSALADLEKSSLVSEMAHVLHSAMGVDELYEIVERFAPRLFPGHPGALFVVDRSGNMIEVMAAWGNKATRKSIFSPDDCWALRQRRPYLVSRPDSELICRHAVRNGHQGQICVPMMAQSQMLGFLHLQSAIRQASGEVFTPSELRLVHSVAEEIALPLASVRLRDVLRHWAFRDSLTELYNRRFFQESLDLELLRAARKRRPVALVMLDVDRFKQVNDANGHGAGDALLQAVSRLLQSKVRKSDVLCRFGGDEFSIVMPETSMEDAARRANEWRSAIKLLKITWQGNVFQGLTVSMGIASYPDCITSEALLQEADAALYAAKASGRDQVKTCRLVPQRKAI
jgi:diguanylate cyclase (GGDEF)-like protein